MSNAVGSPKFDFDAVTKYNLPGMNNDAGLSRCKFSTPLGWVEVIASPRGLQSLTLPPAGDPGVVQLAEGANAETSFFGDLPDRVNRYLQGEKVFFPDRLDLSGATAFQQQVWELTRSIPYGETRSYSWVAAQMGRPRACRAVGQALFRNPLCLIIPCHRVIASNGGLGGFSGGLELKRLLLRMESQERL